MTGVIVKGIGGFYYVQTDEGLFESLARGIFRKDNIAPAVGDRVHGRRRTARRRSTKPAQAICLPDRRSPMWRRW